MLHKTGNHKGAEYRLEELEGNRTKLVRRSPFTGKLHETEFDLPFHQFLSYYAGEALIQNAFPTLNADEREFIMTGITPEEWNSTLGPEE